MVCFKLSLASISSKYKQEWVHINCSQSESKPCKHGYYVRYFCYSLQWRHNGLDSVSNHQPHRCLLSRLFGRWSKKTAKLRVTGLCAGDSPGPVNFPNKGPVTRKMFPFDGVIMCYQTYHTCSWSLAPLLSFDIGGATRPNAWVNRYDGLANSHQPSTLLD